MENFSEHRVDLRFKWLELMQLAELSREKEHNAAKHVGETVVPQEVQIEQPEN